MAGMGELKEWVGRVESFADDAAAMGADTWAESIDDALRSDTGDGRLSRPRDAGTATVEVSVRGTDAEVTAAGSMAVWSIIENGTRPHTIQARRGSALMTPYGPKSMVQHIGMSAKNTWTNGVEDGVTRVEVTLTAEWNRELA